MYFFSLFGILNNRGGNEMMKTEAYAIELQGNSYEVGYQLGKIIASKESLKRKCVVEKSIITVSKLKEEMEVLERWCPGLTKELQGLADALCVDIAKLQYVNMTYLIPRCSQMAILPSASKTGKPLLARNYEYTTDLEDFCFIKTSVTGKYTHIGTSMLFSGRDEGCNEHGLAVTMSSCGVPVVDLPNMKQPKIKGLQYWVVIRAILEHCRNVTEAIEFIKEMPIAFNMNMILLEATGQVALVQTMDGKLAINQQIDDTVFATNHSVLKELQELEPYAFVHSIRRYQYIKEQIVGKKNITSDKLKRMLLANYPNGLCLYNYNESFGTTKSMVISPRDGTIELCWGGNGDNGWQLYDINLPVIQKITSIHICDDKMIDGIFTYQAL